MVRASASPSGWQGAHTIAKGVRTRRPGISKADSPSARKPTTTSSQNWPNLISRVSRSPGGDPLCSPEDVTALAKEIKEKFPQKDIWIYTGFTFEEIEADPKLAQILPYADVIVDGEYVQALRDVTLAFRGSRNQRILWLKDGKIVRKEEYGKK